MERTLPGVELRTKQARIHVYTYRYDTPSHQSRSPQEDVLALFVDQARGARGLFRSDAGTSRLFPLGGLMIVPARVSIEASGPGGDRRLASCTMVPGILPAEFDRGDLAHLAMCGDIRDPHVRAAMQRMAQEAVRPGFGHDVLIDSLAMGIKIDLARYLMRTGPREAAHVGMLAQWQLRRLEDHVQSVEGGGLRIADLAALLEMSPGHLVRTFRKTTGRTVHQFVEEARLARARVLLSETDLPLKRIAAQLGFATPSSFSLAFRRATGVTPGRFRGEESAIN
ncbi:helix-turn-helix transcriptional regulator [Sphingomonas jatrophae]|uniref:AraC family transcriptional regulator n=1 Tax=Sphingomonas jatrophae TaxID=1166337 RepID=A0A1I6KJS0_9SPHN|nr:helix-turn-helix transcriptional regulator [Sphingomonas jatrophae]SFR91479.1 AraC family transcriptional regulator [Sphingomonas jatrophae]